jgi:hypothetical protein
MTVHHVRNKRATGFRAASPPCINRHLSICFRTATSHETNLIITPNMFTVPTTFDLDLDQTTFHASHGCAGPAQHSQPRQALQR